MGVSVLAGYDHKTLYRFAVAKPSSSHSIRFSTPSSNFARRYISLPLAGLLRTDSQRPCLTKDTKKWGPFWSMTKSNLPSSELALTAMASPRWSVTLSECQPGLGACSTDGTGSAAVKSPTGDVLSAATDDGATEGVCDTFEQPRMPNTMNV